MKRMKWEAIKQEADLYQATSSGIMDELSDALLNLWLQIWAVHYRQEASTSYYYNIVLR